MAKLTDTQLIVLSKAAAREDGLAVIPDKMNKPAALKVGASLVARKLMREVRAKPGMPIWREDSAGRPASLMITREGRKAIGVDDNVVPEESSTSKKGMSSLGDGARASASTAGTPIVAALPRAGSKQALVVGMLSAKSGATLDALVAATGWLPHTTRAALTGLRHKGLSITRERYEGKPSVYRITQVSVAA